MSKRIQSFDGVKAGHKHTAPEVHTKILQRMTESRRRYRARKPSNGKWMGRQVLTRVCTKAEVKETGR